MGSFPETYIDLPASNLALPLISDISCFSLTPA